MDPSQPQTSDSFHTPQKPRHFHASPPSDLLDDDANDSHPSWSTITPKKLPIHPPRPKKSQKSAQNKLPEQYEMLLRLFNGLDSALRLLRMRKSVPFFSKIIVIVESITGRRFAHGHLAQMKYLMPDQVLIKRVSVVDEKTSCMKSDLHVTLIRAAIKNNRKRKRGTDHKHCVKKLFRSQLLEFVKAHPDGTDIPGEVLPEPFNEQIVDSVAKMNENDATSSNCAKVSSSHVHEEMPQVAACHISQSFKRHFSSMSLDKKIGKLSGDNVLDADVQLPPVQARDSSPCKKSPDKSTSPTKCSISISPVSPPDTKMSATDTTQIAGSEGTPVKSATTTPAKLMLNTPALHPPPRSCSLSPDEDSKKVMNSVSRSSAARSLQFDCPKNNAHVELDLDDVESADILEILPQSLVESLKENEKKIEQQTLRRMKLNGLPKLFDRVYYLFQSIKYSAIRREALLHRLTTCHSDIVDESEVEEQLKLLQEVLPEWMSQKLSPNSDVLLSIDKSLDSSMLRAKLHKAT